MVDFSGGGDAVNGFAGDRVGCQQGGQAGRFPGVFGGLVADEEGGGKDISGTAGVEFLHLGRTEVAHVAVPVDAGAGGAFGDHQHRHQGGNFGHGNSIFGIISNQQDVGGAKKQVVDSDAYSHFSFVRTLQDMFQIADPAVDASYLNRAKYTEAFITANIAALPEYSGSADTHFDSVRPINHAYVIPAGYTQKLYPADIVGVKNPDKGNELEGQITPQVGPDATQANVWATK